MQNVDPVRRLLSHRLRGFSCHEGSLDALRKALAAGARYLEIDTRVTADGEILVFHDSRLERLTDARGRVADYDVSTSGPPRFKGSSHERVPTLTEFVTSFAQAGDNCELCIDIKDYGAEEHHWRLLHESGIVQRVWIVSWLPEVLLRIHRIDPHVRLSFSHLPLTRQQRALRLLARLLRSGLLLRVMGRCARLATPGTQLRDVRLYVDQCNPSTLPDKAISGLFPVHILSGLPDGPLGDALRASRGAVGLPALLLTRQYARQAHDMGLKVFVFSVDTPGAVQRTLTSADPDVIFTNNPELFRLDWTAARR